MDEQEKREKKEGKRESYLEEIFPPVILEGVAVALHDLKHHCQPPAMFRKIHNIIKANA